MLRFAVPSVTAANLASSNTIQYSTVSFTPHPLRPDMPGHKSCTFKPLIRRSDCDRHMRDETEIRFSRISHAATPFCDDAAERTCAPLRET
jgi:hypothetical protein